MSRSSEKRGRSESGSVLVLMFFIILSTLFVAALAIDAGRLYLTRMTLQKLSDTAALSVVGYTIHAGTPAVTARFGVNTLDQLSDANLSVLATEVVEANLVDIGWPSVAAANITVQARGVTAPNTSQILTVEVDVERPMGYVLMDKLPAEFLGMSRLTGLTTLRASARSARKVANVSLIVDSSRSMACPSFQTCECLSPSRSTPCQTPTKMDTLIAAMRPFLKRFDLNRDRLQFVPFQTVANPYTLNDIIARANAQGFPIPFPPNLPADRVAFNTMVDRMLDVLQASSLQPLGNTNLCDGLLEAERAMEQALGVNDPSARAYVVFSDGAPTAATLDFVSPSALSESRASTGEYKYVLYTNEWRTSAKSWPAPASLGNREAFRPLPEGGLAFNDLSPPGTPACGPASSPVPASDSAADMAAVFNQVFGSCVNNLGYFLPKGVDAQNNAVPYGVGGANDPGFTDWQEQYFNCALKQSDLMRMNSGVLFVIGLGNPANSSTTDCYQDVNDTQSRHDYFLARIANDYDFAKQQHNFPECTFTGFGSYSDWNATADPRHGEYFPISQNDNLDARLIEVYEQVAVKIQLSLLQ